jgi:hypothetical protein
MRLRSRHKGAAIAEFVIVAPVLTLLGAGCFYFGKAYEGRIETRHRARSDAWARATSGDCDGSFGVSLFDAEFLSKKSKIAPELAAQAPLVMGDLFRPTKDVTARATGKATEGSGPIAFLRSQAPTESVYLVCNDKGVPPTGDDSVLVPFAEIWLQHAAPPDGNFEAPADVKQQLQDAQNNANGNGNGN